MDELYDKLLSMASFTLPESLVEKQKERLIEQARHEFLRMGMPENRWEEQKETAAQEAAKKARDQVKLYFILQRVAELEGIAEDEIELEKRLVALAEESKRPIEEARRMFEEDLRESMREGKTVDFLIANAKFDEN